jgi:cell division protein FtsL
MQAAQRKTEYRPSSAASGKRVVKMDGNVAYIRKGESTAPRGTSGTSHPVRVGSSKSAVSTNKSAASPAGRTTHPIRVGGRTNTAAPKSRETFRGDSARPMKKRVVHSGAAPKSSVIVNVNKAAAKQAKRVHTGVVSTIFVIFVGFCALSVLISRYAAISTIGSENSKIKSDINAVEVKIEELKVDMELQDNLENVRDTALNVLKMTYPDQSQKVYIDMS